MIQTEKQVLNNLLSNALDALKNSQTRLKYILVIAGVQFEEGKETVPQDFLMNMMDINEDIMEFKMDPNDNKKNKLILKKNRKIKILICTHDFMDSIHVHGKNFFSDFHEWIYFLGKLSNDKNLQ